MILSSEEAVRRKISGLLETAEADEPVVLTQEYWSGKEFLKKAEPGAHHYYFYYQNKLWDMEERSSILALQSLLLQREDYEAAKTYNEFLIFVTRLQDREEWLFYPREIQIEHTNRCNARCVMCGHFNADKRRCRDLPWQTFLKLEKFLPFCRCVGLHGYGEPFLVKNLTAYLEVYRKYGVRLYTNSNLNYLPEELLPYIRDLFDEINVSCDSADPRTYAAIRKGLSLERLKANVRRLKEACPGVRLRLFAVIMRQNLRELPKLVEFAAEYGFSSVVLTEMIAMEANGNYLDAPELYPDTRSFYLKQALKKARELGIPLSYPREALLPAEEPHLEEEAAAMDRVKPARAARAEHSGTNLIYSRKPLTEEVEKKSLHRCRGICDVFLSQLYCSLDGKLAACCVDGYHYTAEIGDISSAGGYWSSPGVRRLRDCFQKGILPSICSNCNYILVDGLKYLTVQDREAYLKKVNQKGS